MPQTESPQAIIEAMHAIADDVGIISARRFRGSYEVADKAPTARYDPVTDADREIETLIREQVARRFPHHGFIGEEFAAHTSSNPRHWIVDPIDGTRSFLLGVPTWGVMMAVADDDHVVAGLVAQPFTGERYWGWRPEQGGASAHYRGPDGTRQLTSSATREPAEMILSTTDPYLFRPGTEAEAFDALRRTARLTRYGLDCYGYCRLAAGSLDAIVESGLSSYDVAALVPVIEGAGGIVTTWGGGNPIGGGQIVASANPTLHERLLATLAPAAST
ncbi:MAG: histidinol-phosphatase [Rhizobiales bacterium]|nr:histidinol-phosphatase [Hyphomicrobiales bacterium]